MDFEDYNHPEYNEWNIPLMEEAIISEADLYLKVDTASGFYEAHFDNNLGWVIQSMAESGNTEHVIQLIKDLGPLATEIYGTLREYYESTEEYEKCLLCKEKEADIRRQLMKMQVVHEGMYKHKRKTAKEAYDELHR